MIEQDIKKIKNIRRSLQSATKNASKISDDMTKEMLTRAFDDMSAVLTSIIKNAKSDTFDP